MYPAYGDHTENSLAVEDLDYLRARRFFCLILVAVFVDIAIDDGGGAFAHRGIIRFRALRIKRPGDLNCRYLHLHRLFDVVAEIFANSQMRNPHVSAHAAVHSPHRLRVRTSGRLCMCGRHWCEGDIGETTQQASYRTFRSVADVSRVNEEPFRYCP